MQHKPSEDGPPADARGADHERVVNELRLLLDAVAQRADEYLSRRAETTATSSASCGWCPLCTIVSMLRGQRTDLRLVEQMAAVVTVIRQLLAEPQDESRQSDASRSDPPEPASDVPAPDVRVQRINIQRVGGRVLRGQVGASDGPGH